MGKEKRSEHSCLTISTPSENKVLVCGGDGRTDCEIWTNGQWTNGPTVPSSTYGSRMVKPSLNSQYAAFVDGGYMGQYQQNIWNKKRFDFSVDARNFSAKKTTSCRTPNKMSMMNDNVTTLLVTFLIV